MKKDRKLLWLLPSILVAGLLLLNSAPASAGYNPDRGRPLLEARVALECELFSLLNAGFAGIAHSEDKGEITVFVEDEQTKGRVPRSFGGYVVRTEVTGTIEAFSTQVAEPATGVSEDRQDEVRPLVGGTSVSASVTEGSGVYRSAGTMGMITYDNKTLSNAHIIAMKPGTNEFLSLGTPIIQPGSRDGGRPGSRVGELEAYIAIDFGDGAQNYADAAIGSIDTGVDSSPGGQFDEEGDYWIEGWTEVSKGDSVRKSGRTTGVTIGEVAHTNASCWVRYGDQSAYFVDQILVTQENWSFSARGDSGSAVDKDGEFVGLIFAGSDTLVAVSKAEHIIAGLGIAVEPPEGSYSLTISSTHGGSVTIPGEGRFVREGETVIVLAAVPDEYYGFVQWTGDVDEIDNAYDADTSITMRDNYSVTAAFELEEGWSSLTISSTPGGSVIEPGEGTLICETNAVVEVVAEADECYRFVQWTGDVDTVGDVHAAVTTIAVSENQLVTANFELEEGWHSLAISGSEGGFVVEPGVGMRIYEAGEVVFLVAEADEDYQFVKWTGDVDAIGDVHAASTNVTMQASYSITAQFESWHSDPLVQLTVSSTGGGSVTDAGEGVFLLPLGIEVGLVAKPDEGYQFMGWAGDVNTIADASVASTTIIMDNSYSVRASFESVGGGCFIATAAYGTPMAKEIQILREFRDGYLLTNPLGRVFVDFYYRVSPPIAEFINGHPGLKPIVRAGLVPAVEMSTVVVGTASAEMMAMLSGLLVLVAVALAAWVREEIRSAPERDSMRNARQTGSSAGQS